MKDTNGKEIEDNLLVYGCNGCNTTGGKICCPVHGPKPRPVKTSWGNCPCGNNHYVTPSTQSQLSGSGEKEGR